MIASTISTAGRLITAPGMVPGAAHIQTGSCQPKPARIRWKYPLHPIATVMEPTAYSRMRSQPIVQATISPSVAYAYAYALPEIGIIAANSA